VASDQGRDFRGARLDDADFSGARLHGPNFEGTRITDGWLRDADISGFIGGLRVNGVEVAPLVEAELERVCVPPDSPGHPAEPHTVLECLHVILDEEWEHSRYANRDLDARRDEPG
jgi:hypothetical protein